MHYLGLSLLIGLTASAATLIPIEVQAQSFDYNRVTLVPVRPMPSNDVLSFFGDWTQNEGYVTFRNLDPTAPDAGHISFRPGAMNAQYYVTSPEDNLVPTGAIRTAGLQGIAGLPNFSNYLNTYNIPLNSIGAGFGVKVGKPITKTWNLGADQLGQDWYGEPGSPIEEYIYNANPDDVEQTLLYGSTKIVGFEYTPAYFISADDIPGGPVGNWNIFLTQPTRPFKLPGLNPLESGLADAFLQDVAAGGGFVQQVSEDQPDAGDFNVTVTPDYLVVTVSYPLELRIVSVPESSSVLGLLAFGLLGFITCVTQQKKSEK